MKFSGQKDSIVRALTLVKKAIPSKTTRSIFKNIFVEATDDNMIGFRATDGDFQIEVIISANVEVAGTCVVDSIICDLLDNFSSESDIKFSHSKKLSVSQGKRRHNIATADVEEFPNKLEVSNYVSMPIDIADKFSKVSISVETHAGRDVLRGYYIDPGLGYIITTDGIRMCNFYYEDLKGDATILPAIHIDSLLSSIKESDDLETSFGPQSGIKGAYYGKDKQFQMRWEAVINGISGEFPIIVHNTIEKLKNSDSKLVVITNKSDLLNVLAVANLYYDRAQGLSQHVVFSKDDDGVHLAMDIKDLASMNEPLECQCEGVEEFEIWLSPKLLIDVIKVIDSDKVELRFVESEIKEKFKVMLLVLDRDNPDFGYLQMPMINPEGD